MQRNPFILCAFLFITMSFSTISFAETLWQRTKYGMTMDEVRKVLPQLATVKPTSTVVHGESENELSLDNIRDVGC